MFPLRNLFVGGVIVTVVSGGGEGGGSLQGSRKHNSCLIYFSKLFTLQMFRNFKHLIPPELN